MSDAEPIRILLVEDSYLARVGLETALEDEPGLEVVGSASDGIEGLERYRALAPDVVITDVRMPRFDGVQLTAALVAEPRRGRVLVVTHYDGDETVWKALRAGALGYLTKDTSGPELVAAVRAVAAGQRYLPGAIAARIADRVLQPALSPRELQVLDGIFKGGSNRDIARDLALSERTVAMYVGFILDKLGAKSRTEAVAIALDRGILVVG
jgi:DNA-binding NarL/FixJ family response regulator